MGQEARFASQAAFVAPKELSKVLMNAQTVRVDFGGFRMSGPR